MVVRLIRVHSRTLGFVVLIRCRWVLSHGHKVLLGLSGVVGYTHARLGVSTVHPATFGSLAHALGIVGFIRGPWVGSRTLLGVVVFIRGHWIRSRTL